jgi:hypothetical protein
MNKTFGLVSVQSVNDFLAFIKPIWRQLAKDGTPIILKLSTKSEDYTSAQRRLYFSWITQFANKFGEYQESVHHDMKRRFLIRIYMRDDPDFNAMCECIAKLKTNEVEQYNAIREGVIKLTSITKATKVQMTEYMDLIYRFAASQGLALIDPEDLKHLRSDER